jgi:hypothetical protein
MKILINPSDRATVGRMHPGAELVHDTWKAVPSGYYVDLEKLEGELSKRMAYRPPKVDLGEVGTWYARWWAYNL